MNDQELADAVVAHGVGRLVKHIGDIDPRYSMDSYVGDHSVQDLADQFVTDWRVAGALMEKVTMEGPDKLRTVMGSYHPTIESFEASVSTSATNPYGTYLDRSNESLPRAIIEACIAALDKQDGGFHIGNEAAK